MKKILIISFVLLTSIMLVISGFVTGCKQATTVATTAAETTVATTAAETTVATTAAETTVAQEPVTLEFWHVYPQTDLANIIQETVNNFMKANPNIKINVLPLDTPVYLQKLPMSFGSETPPDIFYAWGNQGNAVYIDEGFILDVDKEMQEIKDEVNPGAINAFSSNGKIYGAGHTLPSKIVIYNKEIFAKYNLTVPKTWDELLAVCETLKENGVIPFAFGQKDNAVIVHWHSEFVVQETGDVKPNAMFLEPNKLDNPEFIESLRTLKSLAQNGYLDPDALSLTDLEAHAVFENGDAAMVHSGTWNFPEYLEILGNAPDFKRFEYGTFPLSGTEGGIIFSACAGLEGSAKTEHPAEVAKFLQYWVSYENAIHFIGTAFETPNTNLKAMADSADKFDYLSQAVSEGLANNTPYIGIADFFRNVEFNVPLNEEYQKMMWQADRTPEEAAKNLNEAYAKFFD